VHLIFIDENVLKLSVIKPSIIFSKFFSTYASLNNLSSARAQSGVVSECFNIIELPRIMGEIHALKGIQKGEE
jgi:hypothetical protein